MSTSHSNRSPLARQLIEQQGAQGTTVLVGAAEPSWTRRLVEHHGAYFDPWWKRWFMMERPMT